MKNQLLCVVSPRFYPIVGGVEKYLQDIADYCSDQLKVRVITSNLKNSPNKKNEMLNVII